MSQRSRHGAVGLLVRQAKTDAPLGAIVAVVAAVAAFLVSAGPGAFALVADRELRHTLAESPAVRHDLTATAAFGYANGASGSPSDADQGFTAITSTVERVAYGVDPPLASVLGAPQWAVTASREIAIVPADPARTTVLYIGVSATPGWRGLVTFVEGTAPDAWTGPDATDGDAEGVDAGRPVPVALSVTAAKAMELGVGTILDLDRESFVVSGLYEPTDAGDPFWGHLRWLRDAAEGRSSDGRTVITADVLIDPGSTAALQSTFVVARIEAWYPLLIDRIAYADVPRIAEQIRELSAGGVEMSSGEVLQFTSSLAADLEAVVARVSVATALFALLVAGPLGVVLAVLALTAGAIADRRAAALSLARARGASGLQLRAAMMLEGAILSVPAAAIGVAVAYAATQGRIALGDLWPAALIALATPVLLAVAVPAPVGRARRPHVRWVIEALVAGLAAASLFLLFRRGITPGVAGVDPLLAAAPLLLAAAVTIAVLRVHPWLMRAAQRAAGRARGAVALVGSARAVRVPSLGFAAAFALIVGVSVAVFSAGMAASLGGALAAAEPAKGADAAPLDPGHPLALAVFALLAAAAAIPLLFCVVAIVMTVIAAARSRNSTVGVLRILGFSARQVRHLVEWELVPVAIVAIVAGVALGAGEVFVLSAAIDLPALVGGDGATPPGIDVGATVAIAAVFACATALAGGVATAVARHRTPGSIIRMGTE